MKMKTTKKALSLILAILMIALAIPFTAVTVAAEEEEAAKIQSNGIFFQSYRKKSDGNIVQVDFAGAYPVTKAIDGDVAGDEAWTNNYSSLKKSVGFDDYGTMYCDIGNGDYYGIFVITLEKESELDSVSIWSPYAKNRSDFVNDAYDIWYSIDGTIFQPVEGASFNNMCGDDTNAGANSGVFKEHTVNGKTVYEHEIDMKKVTAKYVAVAVSETCKKTNKNISLAEITVDGKVVPATKTTIANVTFHGIKTSGSNAGKDVGMRVDRGTWGSIQYATDGRANTEAQSYGFKEYFPTYYLDPTSKSFICNYSEEGVGEYYALLEVELNTLSSVNEFTIWSPKSYYTEYYFANDAYDIYYSVDGAKYTKINEETFKDICPNDENKTPANQSKYFTLSTLNGQEAYKHAIDMKDVEAKYIIIAVSSPCYSTNRDAIFNEITVDATPIEETEVHAEYTAYADANVGDLLYAVNFNVTDDGFAFADGAPNNGNWSRTGAEVSEDGSSVTFYSTTSHSSKRAKYWTQLTEYPVAGSSFTVEFTLESSAFVGILLDCGAGFVINPSTNTTKIAQYEHTEKLGSAETYAGTGATKQTYAIELSNEPETKPNVDNYNTYYPIVYKLYVKNEATGTYEFVRETPADKASSFEWEKGGWECLYLNFARYGGASNEPATISNVTIKKGIGFIPALNLVDGASMRMASNSGLRFTGIVGKQYVDGLKAKYGEANVTLGMLITPTDYLKDNSLAFTKEALDACTAITGAKYLEIDAATVLEEGNNYKVNCAIVDILEANYDRAFSAILYVKVTDGDTVTYTYSAYNETENSRTVADVAAAAYADVADQQSDEYPNEVVIDGTTKYSPYTEAQRTTLKAFFQ